MSLATGSRSLITQIVEGTFGTTPATPTMKTVRKTGESLELVRGRLVSPEILEDGQKSDVRLTERSSAGDLDFVLTYGDFDDFLAGGLRNAITAWTPDVVTGPLTNLTWAAAGRTVTRGSGSWITDGWVTGDTAIVTGSASNNVTAIITVTSATVLTFAVGTSIADEAPSSSTTLTSKRQSVGVGTTKTSFSIEVGALDIAQYELYKGQVLDKLTMDWKTKQMIACKASFIGQDMVLNTVTAASSVTAKSSNSPMDTFSGSILEGGSAIAVVTGMSLSINNNVDPADVLMSATMVDFFLGDIDISGTLNVFFKDAVLYNKFINETESSFSITAAGLPATKTLTFAFPRIKYTTFKKQIQNSKGIPVAMSFDALKDATTGNSMKITRSGV